MAASDLIASDDGLQAMVERALQGLRDNGTFGRLHEEYQGMIKEADQAISNSKEIRKLFEASMEQLQQNIKKSERPVPALEDHNYTSERNESNPWSIHELYDEIEGKNMTIPDIIKRKKQKLNGEVGYEPIEMIDEDKELFTHRVTPDSPWTIFDLYADMRPHENTLEVLARKKRELIKKREESSKLTVTAASKQTPSSAAVYLAAGPRVAGVPGVASSAASGSSAAQSLSVPGPSQAPSTIESDDEDDDVQVIQVKEKQDKVKSKSDSPGIITNFPQPQKGDKVLAKWKENIWYVGNLVDIIKDQKGQEKFKVRLDTGTEDYVTILVSGMQIACYHTAKQTEITIGQRVAALFREEDGDDCLYAGIVAELPMTINEGRYLVFFDDGYVQYMSRKRIHLVYQNSKEVWKDVEEMMADFVKDYLDQYPFRPLVKAFKLNEIKTEFQGKWLKATVVDVDFSLVLMQYKEDGQKEWLYRGSTRLEPVFRFVMMHKYGEGVTDARVQQNMRRIIYSIIQAHHYLPVSSHKKKKQMARKSSGGSSRLRKVEAHTQDEVEIINLDPDEPKVEIVEETKQEVATNRKVKFDLHPCGPVCVKMIWPIKNVDVRTINPLRLPEVCGWQREIIKQRSGSSKRQIMYKAPCGRSLRSLEEVDRYLTETKITYLAVDHFDFNPFVITLPRNIRLIRPAQLEINDLSGGVEPVPIPCINYVDDKPPPKFKYVIHRGQLDGDKINMDDDFLVGCDCTDNCQDKSKCACQQLTIDATAVIPPYQKNPDAGYTFRRLEAPFRTGVWECNKRCKCSKQCHNRVVQNGLQHRLQVFKTERKGWGIRCLDDIPRGSFVCIYVGHIWNDEEANKRGAEGRDNYFAELDYLEVVEKTKEDYESDVDSDLISSDLSDDESPSPTQEQKREAKEELQASDDSGGGGDASSDEDFVPDPARRSTSTKGSTKIVFRRTSEEKAGDKWSVAFAKEKQKAAAAAASEELEDVDCPGKVMYGYNTTPTKVLNQEQVEAFRQRRLRRSRSQIASLQQADKKSLDDPSSESDSNSLPPLDESKPGITTFDGQSFSKLLQTAIQECKKQHKSDNSGCLGVKEKPDEKKKDSTEAKGKEKGENRKRSQPTRSLFGEEHCYIMDALEAGNLGRFLNHSCSPNLYVQNVFVDTHDLRFPWVSFFAARYIRAGSELTWDYGYEIGSVPGKELLCHCGSKSCKGRLL